jgi:hypothetical protein
MVPAALNPLGRRLVVADATAPGQEHTVDKVEAEAEPGFGAIAEAPDPEFVSVFIDVGDLDTEVLCDDCGAYPRHRLEWRAGLVPERL